MGWREKLGGGRAFAVRKIGGRGGKEPRETPRRLKEREIEEQERWGYWWVEGERGGEGVEGWREGALRASAR